MNHLVNDETNKLLSQNRSKRFTPRIRWRNKAFRGQLNARKLARSETEKGLTARMNYQEAESRMNFVEMQERR